MFKPIATMLAMATVGLMVGCNTVPQTEERREALSDNVQATLRTMYAEDPGLRDFLDRSHGYVVFPSVGKGGLILGGAYGKGEVFERGKPIGYADITQATIGLQAGGQEFAEVIAFEDKAALDRFINDKLAFAAGVSAVALKSGVAAQARYRDGVAVFAHAKGGLMAEAAIGGQQFRFAPLR